LEDAEVVTISSKLQRRPRSEVAGHRGLPVVWPVCWEGEDVASGRAKQALETIAADIQRVSHYQGIITQATESDQPWWQIHLSWRHHRAWLVAAVALYAGIGLVLLVLLAQALATLENLLVWRRLATCAAIGDA
jgi:hypothetical protein